MTLSDLDSETLAYHRRQWERPYESTVAFADFIGPWAAASNSIVDIGCGTGANTVYLAKWFRARFVGIDSSRELIDEARNHPTGVTFEVGDAYRLTERFGVDGVISLQAFSWMPEIEGPLGQICSKIKPRWIAFSSLFYEGDISCHIVVDEPRRPRQSYYNIYSIPRTVACMKMHGYKAARIKPYEIDVDLPKPDNPDLMKTWTLPDEDGRRLQISGPLLLPWYFMCFEKMP
jgi:trans-aconitate methyltransferase